jgi:hypothetical protein
VVEGSLYNPKPAMPFWSKRRTESRSLPPAEHALPLTGTSYLGRYSVRLTPRPDRAEQTRPPVTQRVSLILRLATAFPPGPLATTFTLAVSFL